LNKKLEDFVSFNKKRLVVTVGDSWSWGADMSYNNNDSYRINNHFGTTIAKSLNADWLSLSQCGSGNFWMLDKIQELAKIISKLDYQHIYIICTLTETGRAIFTRQDVDFYSFFKDNHLDKFIAFLNNTCVDNIVTALSSFTNVTLRVGTNFVDYVGDDRDFLLQSPWLKLMCRHHQMSYTGNCQIVSPWVLDDLYQLKGLMPLQKFNNLLTMLTDLTSIALERETLICTVPGIRHLHPDACGHQLWANYVLNSF